MSWERKEEQTTRVVHTLKVGGFKVTYQEDGQYVYVWGPGNCIFASKYNVESLEDATIWAMYTISNFIVELEDLHSNLTATENQ